MASSFSNKMRALLTKSKTNRGQTKDGLFKRSSLMSRAKDLHAEVKKVTEEARAHAQRSIHTVRPAAPPNRDALFQRPKDAPMSEYDKQVAAFETVENEYRGLHTWAQQLKEKIAAFKHDVHELKEVHEPAKKMGKAEHDVEGLENACLNLDSEMLQLEKELHKSKLHVAT